MPDPACYGQWNVDHMWRHWARDSCDAAVTGEERKTQLGVTRAAARAILFTSFAVVVLELSTDRARHRAATLLRRTDGLLNALRSRRRWWHERDASKFLLSAFVEDVRRGAAGVHEELRRPLLDYYLTTDMVAWKALKKALTTLTDLLAKLEGADGERPAENFDRLHKDAADARRAAPVALKICVVALLATTSDAAKKKKKRKAAGPPAKVAELSECAACENWASDATAFVRAKVRHRLNPPPAPAPGEPVGLEPTWEMRLNRTCRSPRLPCARQNHKFKKRSSPHAVDVAFANRIPKKSAAVYWLAPGLDVAKESANAANLRGTLNEGAQMTEDSFKGHRYKVVVDGQAWLDGPIVDVPEGPFVAYSIEANPRGAKKPAGWDDAEDGDWAPPMVANPAFATNTQYRLKLLTEAEL
ncbi:hypothetical protein JL721_2722 [Aureococcus anophagefferens]|nr:hypothetical protein JL721_2722 [Aureococcus anophagefferens]